MSDRISQESGRSREGSLTIVLNIVVALRPEGQPLVEHWRLRLLGGEGGTSPQIFAGEVALGEGRRAILRLIVGGMGRVAAAAAVGVLHGVDFVQVSGDDAIPRFLPGDDATSRLPAFWLNVGICGHGRRPVGDVILAAAVHDVTAGHRFELHRTFEAPCDVAELETHDARVTTYPPGDRAVDMEAAGFVAAARRCGANGRDAIQCLKVVSDNAESPPRDVTRRAERRVLATETERHMVQLLPIVDALCARWMGTALPLRRED
ncbi:MAG: hypothetical protein KAI47_01680 [Deltaproteobacteria bacterium]|nr:hypothetical protein [Deltaproteobacteria bacterium]